MESKYYGLYDEINTFTEETELRTFVKNNSKYLSIGDNIRGEEEVKSVTEGFYNLIANEDFEFILEGKVIDIRSIVQEIPSSQRSCANSMELDYEALKRGCRNDRLARLKTQVYHNNSGYLLLTITHSAFLRGQKRIGCIWMNYRTNLDIIGTPIINSTYNGTAFNSTNIPITSGSLTCSNCYSTQRWGTSSDVTDVGGFATVTRVLVEGTTRGIGANSVIIDCQ